MISLLIGAIKTIGGFLLNCLIDHTIEAFVGAILLPFKTVETTARMAQLVILKPISLIV